LKFETIQMKDMIFADEGPWFMRLATRWAIFYQKLMRVTIIVPPVIFKRKFKGVQIDALANALGINDSEASNLIELHKRRLIQRSLSISLRVLVFVAMAVLIIWPIVVFFENSLLTAFLLIGIFYVGLPVTASFVATLVDKRYADSLCILTVIFVFCELSRDDVLLHPGRRRSLLNRITTLSKLTRLLSVTFPSDGDRMSEWSRKHFQSIELYVCEVEQAVIAPKYNTLIDLRENMKPLIEMFVFSQYGNDLWKGSPPDLETVKEPTAVKRFSVIGKILSPVIPFALLIAGHFLPEFLEKLSFEKEMFFLLVGAWFILALDSSIGLGIIDKVLRTAKEVRGLR
jgi:hypothetical protein